MYPSKFVAIKKGNKLGTTFKAQSFKPDFAASKLLLENAIKNIPMVNEAWRGKQSYGDLVEEFKRLKAEKGIFN